MDIRTARDLGFLGTNVDSALTLDFVHFELVQKAEQGDKTSVFKLHQIVRHYEGENRDQIRKYATDALTRLGELPIEEASGDDVEGGDEGKEPESGEDQEST